MALQNMIRKNLGYHRVLLLVCAVLLYFIYPSEETVEAIRGWKEGKFLFWFYPIVVYLILLWVVLSDLLANVWRFLEFLIKKNTLWHYAPVTLDIVLVIIMWFCYRHNINPPPPEPEEAEAFLRLLGSMFRA